MEFQGKVVLITGAAGGIGKETARLFARNGAHLALIDLDQKALDAVASELELEDYLAIAADVSKEDQVVHFVQATREKYGKIDVFFNNAGIEGKLAPITEITAENFDNVMNVNVKGVFYGLKHVMAVMMEQRSGSIVNTASVAGLKGAAGLSPYVASKHAVIGLTKTAALESAGMGVRVNVVCPSPIQTRMITALEAFYSPGDMEKGKELLEQSIPMKRYGMPSEVAELVLFLSSDRASFITGSEYRVDGGSRA
jgi:3-hydroxybutyrate dehydrogenase